MNSRLLDLRKPEKLRRCSYSPRRLSGRDLPTRRRHGGNSSSSSRPRSAVISLACSASKRPSAELARGAAHARTGSAIHLTSLAPRSRLGCASAALKAVTTAAVAATVVAIRPAPVLNHRYTVMGTSLIAAPLALLLQPIANSCRDPRAHNHGRASPRARRRRRCRR